MTIPSQINMAVSETTKSTGAFIRTLPVTFPAASPRGMDKATAMTQLSTPTINPSTMIGKGSFVGRKRQR